MGCDHSLQILGGCDPLRGGNVQGEVILDQEAGCPDRWTNGVLQTREGRLQTGSGDPADRIRGNLSGEGEPEGI